MLLRRIECILILVQIIKSVAVNGYYVMPYILWDSDNPMFNESICGSESRKFKVKLDDVFRLQCGNYFSNNGLLQSPRTYGTLNYNIYITTDYNTYINRRITPESKHVYDCIEEVQNNKPIVDNKRLGFQSLSPVLPVDYKAGGTYYFFTTSDGTVEGLNNIVGVDSSKHMRFEVYICTDEDPCYERNRINPCLNSDPNTLPRIGGSDQDSVPGFAWMIIGLLIGVIAGAIIGVLTRDRCQRLYQTDPQVTRMERQTSSNVSDSSTPLSTVNDEKLKLSDENGKAMKNIPYYTNYNALH